MSTGEIPLHARSQRSFADIVEEQMKKLMMDNNEEEIKTPIVTLEVKRPFLKKGSGLQKFMSRPISYPKKAVNKEQGKKEAPAPPSKNLKSQSAVCRNSDNSASLYQPLKCIKFCLPKERANVPTTIGASGSKPPTSHCTSDGHIQTNIKTYPIKEKSTKFVEDARSGNQAPAKTKIPPQISTHTAMKWENTVSNSIDPLTYDLVLLRQRKIELEKQLQNCNEVLYISSSSDDENSTTIPHTVETVPLVANTGNKMKIPSSITATKASSREKREELQKQIEIQNAVFAKRNKYLEDELKAVQKEKEDFIKFKQAELEKCNNELTEKLNEVRREKQTFDRYQKLRTDLPGSKERAELNAEKLENKSLREELMKKTVKFNAETKRLQNCLAAAEKKIQIFKKEIQKLTGEANNQFISNVYVYSNGVVERIQPDGVRITEFPNGLVEKYYPDGAKEVTEPNGRVITQRSDGIEEIRTQDGTVKTTFLDGTVIIKFFFGDKETRTSNFVRREFANGAIKTVYPTGRIETQLPNGRVRIKDKDGNILFDNMTM